MTPDTPNGQTQREYLAQMVSDLYTCEWHDVADLLKFGRLISAEALARIPLWTLEKGQREPTKLAERVAAEGFQEDPSMGDGK